MKLTKKQQAWLDTVTANGMTVAQSAVDWAAGSYWASQPGTTFNHTVECLGADFYEDGKLNHAKSVKQAELFLAVLAKLAAIETESPEALKARAEANARAEADRAAWLAKAEAERVKVEAAKKAYEAEAAERRVRGEAREEVVRLAKELYPDDCAVYSRADLSGLTSEEVFRTRPNTKVCYLGGQTSNVMVEHDGDGGFNTYDFGDSMYCVEHIRPDWAALDTQGMLELRDSMRGEKASRQRQWEMDYVRTEWRSCSVRQYVAHADALVLLERIERAAKKARKLRREREEREKAAREAARRQAREATRLSRSLLTEQAEDKLAKMQAEAKKFSASSWGALDGIKL